MNPLMDKQEAEAMCLLRKGNLEAIEVLHRLYARRVKTFVVKNNPAFDESKADDVLQLTFLALTRQVTDRPGSFEHFTSVGNLLYSIALSIIIDLQRAEERDERLKAAAAAYYRRPVRPDERLFRKELRWVVRWALRLLPEAEEEAAALRYLEGYSVKQTAEVTETSVNTTKKRINRSRRKLRRSLRSYWKGGKK